MAIKKCVLRIETDHVAVQQGLCYVCTWQRLVTDAFLWFREDRVRSRAFNLQLVCEGKHLHGHVGACIVAHVTKGISSKPSGKVAHRAYVL